MNCKLTLRVVGFVMLVLTPILSKAQTVTIPDPNFCTFLNNYYPTCMSGGNILDTTCPEIVNETTVNVSYMSISDLTGIEYFTNLTSLNCQVNSLSFLPPLPSGLTQLICNANNLTVLPSLPAGLTELACASNDLSALPDLPAGLEQLQCSSNPLGVLPLLPVTLTNLICENNGLTTLPALPVGLQGLSCSANQLASFPVLPGGLQQLMCSQNMLTALPATLPGSLMVFECNNNLLTSIPPLPSGIIAFTCANNMLQELPLLPEGLEMLYCNNNPDLTCLPILPSTLSSLNYMTNILAFPGTQITCVPNIPPPMISSIPVCTTGDFVNNPNGCNQAGNVEGFVYHDASGNCNYESGETGAFLAKLFLKDGTGTTISQAYSNNGVYHFQTPGPGNYTVMLDTLNKPYELVCSNPGIDSTFTLAANDTISGVDFAVSCPTMQDVGVVGVTAVGLVFPGTVHTMRVFAGDMVGIYLPSCSLPTLGGTLTVTVTGNVNYVGAPTSAVTPSAVSGNVFTYLIPDFSIVDFLHDFALNFETMTTATIGDSICVDVVINSGTTDFQPLNDTYHFCYNVVNSYDPNIKEVYPAEVIMGYDDWLTYTIHFQNTGNAPAMNIKLKDTLSTLIDPMSFELLAYSDPVSVDLNGYNTTFKFDNIMLPDSASDPEGSIGFVQYRVKPLSNLPGGTEIDNKCYIYFDYNAPIITNTATTYFIDNTGLTENQQDQLTLYPNPTTGVFSFQLPASFKDEITVLRIYNVAGELVYEQQIIQAGISSVDISSEKVGIYFMTIQSGDLKTNCKLVKQ